MEYTATLNTIALTAWDTLEICDRQARKDAGKVIRFTYKTYCLLTCRQAKQTYRMIGRALVIMALIVWALAVTVYKWIDTEAAACANHQAEPEITPEPATKLAIEPATEQAETEAEIKAEVEPATNQTTLIEMIDTMSRAALLELAATLEGSDRELHLPKKMTEPRLRRKLKEVFA